MGRPHTGYWGFVEQIDKRKYSYGSATEISLRTARRILDKKANWFLPWCYGGIGDLGDLLGTGNSN
jgi:hypothetical protein